jgi:hypothetical protein
MKTADTRLEYRDVRYPIGANCACWLRVWQSNGWALVLATELDPSPGASVTNSAERWAEEACKEYDLNPDSTTFVEHYDHRKGDGDENAQAQPNESFDFVSFEWIGDSARCPAWRHGTKVEVELLIGEKLP